MIFNYDPAIHAGDLESAGFVHLKNVLSEEFTAYLAEFLHQAETRTVDEDTNWKITGKKRQFVFDFPSDEAAEAFRAGLAGLTGMDPATLTVSERHLKLYEPTANPWPAPHKDRSASHYSVGIPIHLGPGSSVCIFPDLDPGPNTADKAAFLGDKNATDASAVYNSEKAVMLNEQVGDIVVFLGSSLYHERVRAAGTAVLYIKINSEGHDPLGEDIFRKAAKIGA